MIPEQHELDTARRSASLVEQQRALASRREAEAADRARKARDVRLCIRCNNGEHGKLRCCRPWSCACVLCGEVWA